MLFSKRTDWDLSENAFTVATRAAVRAGRDLIDLTSSNPTACGFNYDSAALLAPLSATAALHYRPEPFGMLAAREAVARYYRDRHVELASDRICLTTSTSEAYSFLFRLLCDPDDEVLIARPSYPLFDFIAQLDGVRLVEYPLVYDGSWQIDLHRLASLITQRTRAVIIVHPNNPTGNYASTAERNALGELCAKHKLALIVDEVFLDYSLGVEQPTFLSSAGQALTFVLSGISKVCALPQMKLSWIALSGEDALVRSALERLEVIADTFLSVSAPTQHALPFWLGALDSIQEQIRKRTQSNLHYLRSELRGTGADCLALQGGWTALLRIPRFVNGHPFAEAALEQGVIVQPGEFYGLGDGHVVLSLLTSEERWQQGITRLPIS